MHLNFHKQRLLQDRLLDWFAANQRDLPWRRGYDPYTVWISEVMLQQTQMSRAVACFERWMERFPDPAALAAADQEEVLLLWEGLGYYSRARNLHKAAIVLTREHGKTLPANRESLLRLPGIGPYTAGAICSIAFNQPETAVDANVERVLARVLDIDTPVKQPGAARAIRRAAADLIPPGRARDFNQALMELGALCCSPRGPGCSECPLHSLCEARRLGIVSERPVPGKKLLITPLQIVAGVLVHQGRVFIQKRLPGSVWGGLWEFPGGRVEPGETPARASARELQEETGFRVSALEEMAVIRHGYTTYRVRLHCFSCSLRGRESEPVLTAAQDFRWALPGELDGFAFPAAHRKLIDMMAKDDRFQDRLKQSLGMQDIKCR
ncbi:MAG: A/G-specific adenine glycosylase [Desulfohalobiaceae bacterium]